MLNFGEHAYSHPQRVGVQRFAPMTPRSPVHGQGMSIHGAGPGAGASESRNIHPQAQSTPVSNQYPGLKLLPFIASLFFLAGSGISTASAIKARKPLPLEAYCWIVGNVLSVAIETLSLLELKAASKKALQMTSKFIR